MTPVMTSRSPCNTPPPPVDPHTYIYIVWANHDTVWAPWWINRRSPPSITPAKPQSTRLVLGWGTAQPLCLPLGNHTKCWEVHRHSGNPLWGAGIRILKGDLQIMARERARAAEILPRPKLAKKMRTATTNPTVLLRASQRIAFVSYQQKT